MHKRTITLFIVALVCWGCSKNTGTVESNALPAAGTSSPVSQTPSAASSQNVSGQLHYKVPEGWIVERPTSDMRFAQYKLPKAGGDSEDALLIVYYFGKGQGGPAQANIDRWIGQMQQPDGSSSKEKAKTESLTVNGLAVKTVDVLGNYSGGMSPDSAPAEKKSIYRLRAAVIEAPNGNYYVKLTGPEKTVAHWDQGYMDYIKSFEFK
jgi:hypothetical protein